MVGRATLLLNPLPSIQRPGESGRVAGLTRLIRQVCLLREQGDAAGAARLQEGAMAAAVRELRLAQGPDALSECELQGMFAAEERRVAEAVILSELLLPQLVGCLPAASRPAQLAPQFTSETMAPPPAHRPERRAPAITDLLDAMLAAERTASRPAPVTKRQP